MHSAAVWSFHLCCTELGQYSLFFWCCTSSSMSFWTFFQCPGAQLRRLGCRGGCRRPLLRVHDRQRQHATQEKQVSPGVDVRRRTFVGARWTRPCPGFRWGQLRSRCGTVWDTSMLKVLLAGLRHERRDHLDLGPVPDLREPILTAGAAACLAFQTVQRMK